jgi:DNA-binding CsgD family transcriptional regulator
MYEVFWNSENNCLLVEDFKTKMAVPFDNMPLTWALRCNDAIRVQFPDAYEKLCHILGEDKAWAHARVKQFIACNFSEKDGIPDIDEEFNFNIEKTACPARGTVCQLCLCSPAMNTEITSREKQLLSFFIQGSSEEEIAELLFISPYTVHNHIKNMYRKIGVAGKSNPDRRLIAYVHAKKMII